jgi:heat shock protein HslJ
MFKNVNMKLVTFISAGALILFSAFIMKKNNREQQSLYDRKWSLKKIHHKDSVEEVVSKAFIQFNREKKSAGGNGSCNTFGSTTAIHGSSISFSNIFSTKMYCEGVQLTEESFFRLLAKVNRYELKDKTLMLYLDKELLLVFEGS